MLRSIYNSWSGIAACERSAGQTAHNLANLNTTAYKRSELVFGDILYRELQQRRFPHASEERLPAGQGVHPQAVAPFLEQGVMIASERPLDLAISGEGYFRLLDPADGRAVYSRNGSFSLDANGRVVNAAGDYLDVPFTLDRRSGDLLISPEGMVVLIGSAGEVEELGQIRLYRFVSPAGLTNDGAGRYLESASSGRPEEGLPGADGFGRICQYYLEQSNAHPVVEMVQLMLAQRALQANVRSLMTADELQALVLQVKL